MRREPDSSVEVRDTGRLAARTCQGLRFPRATSQRQLLHDFMKEVGEAQFKVYGGGDDKYDEALVKESTLSSVL